MAKFRYVNTHFWHDTYITSLPPYEKLLFLYFITNSFANICGIYEVALTQVCIDTAIPIADVERILIKFRSDKKIAYYKGYVIVLNFQKHQNQNSPTVRKGIEVQMANVPEDIIREIEVIKSEAETLFPVQSTTAIAVIPKVKSSHALASSVIEQWNRLAETHGLAKVAVVSSKRASCILSRLKEKEFDYDLILNKITQSPYLLGQTVDWKVTFDFVFCSKNNYIKILEGNYDNKTKQGGQVDSIVDTTRSAMHELELHTMLDTRMKELNG